MIDIEDRTEISDEIPYRLVSLGYGINSVQYHRAVFICLKGNFYDDVDLSRRDNHALFTSRRKVGWKKSDSLFDAWLLANFNESRSVFDLELFTR